MRTSWVTGLIVLIAVGACSSTAPVRTVRVATLEGAEPLATEQRTRTILSDPTRLGSVYRPLGPRLGLVQVRTEEEWARLAAVAPGLGPCPDLEGGIVIGLASHIGLPLDGDWPIRVQSVRAHEGAGLLCARFNSGSYLPDGTTYLETAYVRDLVAVLAVDVNGVRFYPE